MKQQFRCWLSMLLVATLISSTSVGLAVPPPYQWWMDTSFINAMNRNIEKFTGDYRGSYFEDKGLLSKLVIDGISSAPYYPDDIADGYQLYQGFDTGFGMDRAIVVQNKAHHIIAVGVLYQYHDCRSISPCSPSPVATIYFHDNNPLPKELKQKIIRSFNQWAAGQDYLGNKLLLKQAVIPTPQDYE